MVRCFLYGLFETLSVAFRHVAKHGRKSSENVHNLEFFSASVMFRVTFGYVNRVSGNDEHRFIRLLDELNRVVVSIFSYGYVFYPLLQASEML